MAADPLDCAEFHDLATFFHGDALAARKIP
jgi:hypothetical protein